MKEFFTNADFHVASFVGPSFTWCNNKEGSSRIWERLDKCLLNSSALHLVPFGKIKHLAWVASDQSPIVFNLDVRKINRNKSIRVEDTLRSYPAGWSNVQNSWKKADFGEEEEVLHRKLKRTLRALFLWNKNKCRDLYELLEELKSKIMELQIKEAAGSRLASDDLLMLRRMIHELNITVRRLST
ncbi:uncharacterized protein LOC110107538 [Dendrobium catenatum]|uniref:uncharacterized protein LOC110107538 n=1 Tax=Dendrobium catenatum TaxID=906689 RepID=UPI0009F4C0FE|nr:uncharacterized protein LOC110107538 [Dendrobium catenatum]